MQPLSRRISSHSLPSSQNKGVDVSTVQTALANNDMATVNSWVKSYMEAHKETFGNTTHMQKGHGFTVNATAQQAHLQSFITRSSITRALT